MYPHTHTQSNLLQNRKLMTVDTDTKVFITKWEEIPATVAHTDTRRGVHYKVGGSAYDNCTQTLTRVFTII